VKFSWRRTIFITLGLLLSSRQLARASDVETRYEDWLGRIRVSDGQDLYFQVISSQPVDSHPFVYKTPLEKSEQVKGLLRSYQEMAFRYILEKSPNPEDKALLEKKLESGLSPPDQMIVLSRDPLFDHIGPDSIIGTMALSMPKKLPENLTYGVPTEADVDSQHFRNLFPNLIDRDKSADHTPEIRHITSVDKNFTGLLLRMANETMLSHPLSSLAVTDHPNIKVSFLENGEPKELSLPQFMQAHGGNADTAFVQPGGFHLQAFDALRGYYESLGFRLDEASKPTGNLRTYLASHFSVSLQWLRKRAYDPSDSNASLWAKKDPALPPHLAKEQQERWKNLINAFQEKVRIRCVARGLRSTFSAPNRNPE
jgi:hypothetical protein